jgi:hypothetical protein
MLRLRGVYRVLLICRIILLLLRILGVGGCLLAYHDVVGASPSIYTERDRGVLTCSLNPRIHRRVG